VSKLGTSLFLVSQERRSFSKDTEKRGSGFVFDGRFGFKRILAQQYDWMDKR
jgi:hypothetical protein